MTSYLSDEERDEYEALMAECCGDPENGGKRMSIIAERLRVALVDAEQAGRTWATHTLDDALLDGLAKLGKEWLKTESVVQVNHNGQLMGKATRVGRRVRSDSGEVFWQQTLFRDMTWAQLDEWLSNIQSQLHSLGANVTIGRRLFELRDAAPDSIGPGDAAATLGTTIDAWLAEAA